MEPSAPAKADPAQSICVDCGLCCNGSLFDWLRASPEEMKALPKADFISAGDAKGPGFQLACPLLEGTLCTAYGSRPGTCRKFECNLLKQVNSGAVPRAAAVDTIATAKRLLADLRETMRPGESLVAARRRWTLWFASEERAAPAPADAAFILRMTMLNRFLDRHFRKDSKKLTMELDGA